MLALVERLGIDPDPLGPDAGVLARVFAAANRDRDHHLADPDAMLVHPSTLLDDGHLAGLADRIREGDAAARVPGHHRGTGDTIALVAADAEGWAVSLIQSLWDSFGSAILEPETGIIAHDRGACFTLEAGHPNEIAPGKRPFHTLMPVLVHREGRLAAVAGSMGGESQPQINAQNLIRTFDLGMEAGPAIAAPRWTVWGDAGDGTIEAEGSVPDRRRPSSSARPASGSTGRRTRTSPSATPTSSSRGQTGPWRSAATRAPTAVCWRSDGRSATLPPKMASPPCRTPAANSAGSASLVADLDGIAWEADAARCCSRS